MMMAMTVTGGASSSCVSLCADLSLSGTSVSRVSYRMALEFLGERKFCAAGEKKQTNDETGARARQ